MKALFVTILLALTFSANANPIREIKVAYYAGELQLFKVANDSTQESWLTRLEKELEQKYDFHEDMSYIFEAWDEVESHCSITDPDFADGANIDWHTVWNTVASRGQVLGYVLHLVADIDGIQVNGPYIRCQYIRSSYLISPQGEDLTDYAHGDPTFPMDALQYYSRL